MKQTRHFRRLMSLLLIVAMLLSMAVVGFVGVSAADDGLTLTYSFKYENAGFAEGQVTLSSNSDLYYDKYNFYWADDEKALEGYAPITTLNLNKESVTFALGEFTAIPAGATKLIAVESALAVAPIKVDMADAVFDIPESKQFKYADSEKEYNFQTLSDIHFHRDGYDAYKYADEHLTSALNAAELRGAEFVTTCGDNTNYGDVKEWAEYLYTIANSNFTGPVYEVNGNHEPYNEALGSSAHKNILNQYKLATGLDTVTDKMRSELYYEITAPNGDHHIFMALELVNKDVSPKISDNFSPEQMDWLEGLLNNYKNDGKKIFIYEHAPFTSYGAGDNKINPHYTAAMTIDEATYPQTYRFKELLEANKDIVWFSGHTHIDFKYNYNIDNENGTTAYTVHVPSTASTTTVNSSNGLVYEAKADSAQGYFVDVYADATVINGTDLVKNEILPLYTYLVDYSGDALVENDDYTEGEVDPGVDPDIPVTGDTIKIYFSNNRGWENVYLYGFYGAPGQDATNVHWPCGYPGVEMKYVETNELNQDVYMYEIPADIDYIKFSDNSAANNRTDNIPNSAFENNTGFYLKDKGDKYWPYETYVYEAKADTASVGAGTTVYAINSANWNDVCAYYWGGSASTPSWPGTAMTKTGDKVNGFDVYSITFDAAPASIIFNNKDNGSQTDDLTFQAGQYYDVKGGKWYASLSDVPGVDPLATDRYLVGSFNSWSTVADEFKLKAVGEKVAYVELELEAHTTYEFKIVREGAWTSCKETLHITENASALTFSSSVGDNTKITTRDAGTYVFAFGIDTSQLAVTYPAAEVVTTTTEGNAEVPTTTAENVVIPTTTKADEPAPETIKIYFTNNRGWSGAYIYGFYGVAGETSTGEPLGVYPGTEMTFVEVNDLGQDVYCYDVPADIDYIKFCDGDNKGVNNRTDNIPNAEFEDGTGFYLQDKGSKYWPYVTYKYEAPTPTPETTTTVQVVTGTTAEEITTEEQVIVPTTATQVITTTEPDTVDTITVYFTNNRNWSGAYIYGFYGVAGETSTGEPLGVYPGTEMTFVEVNDLGQDVYSAVVPADIDYIKFCDGDNKGVNNRTDNIPNAEFEDGTGFYLQDKGSKYWPYVTYTYVGEDDETTTTSAGEVTTVTATSDDEVVVPTTTKTEIPTTVTTTEEIITTVTTSENITTEEITTTVEASETETTPKPVVKQIRLGDADQNGKVNVKDATEIQKHIAGLTEADGVIALTELGLVAADVDANESVNVKDATAIQKFIAGLDVLYPIDQLIDVEPQPTTTTQEEVTQPTTTTKGEETQPTTTTKEEGTQPTTTTKDEPGPEPQPDSDLSKLLTEVKATLEDEYYYASYVAYANLKKAYFEYKDANMAENEEAAAIAEINDAKTAYETMKKNNPSHINIPKPGTYVVHGNFTGSWIDHEFAGTGNVVSFDIELKAGTYKFVINESGTDNWFKNGGTINDTCANWTYGTSGADTTFVATGGTYTFQFSISNKALTVTKK